MKEQYISPDAQIVKFQAMEALASDWERNIEQGDTSGDDFFQPVE